MYALVLVTCPSERDGERISRALLDKRLAACVSAVPGIRSSFLWKGVVEVASEVLLLIKTRAELVGGLIEEVRRIHPYEVPEILAIPIAGGFKGYLDWIDGETAR
ncbi:MAG: divalent-cation tolerance protein CutA [Candidatus Bathyarchaeia archaeon]